MTTQFYPILGNGFVEVLDVFGDELTIANAARVSFGVQHTELTEGDKKLVKYLYKHKHMSPFRHVFLRLRIHASEVVMRQMAKHIIGIEATSSSAPIKDMAFNEISGRYKVVEEYYYPSVWRKQHTDNKQASAGPCEDSVQDEANQIYTAAMDNAIKTYHRLLNIGVSREQARLILPLSQMTTVLWTASLQAVFNFIVLRDHEHAQYEIREYAKAFTDILKKNFPTIYEIWDKDVESK